MNWLRNPALTFLLTLFLTPALLADEPATSAAETEADTQATAEEEANAISKAAASAPEGLDRGDVAWMLVSAALVLMMTAPGLALFYGGLVRKKNILGVMMQCIALMGVMSVVWACWGYSLAFGKNVAGGFVGGADHLFLKDVITTWDSETQMPTVPMSGSIPTSLFMVFQMMFFIITPALICGAFAERMKFSAMLLYSVLWGTLVYCPLAHWVWSSEGWLFAGKFAAMDYAGGTVVHISSGVSALVCALLIGKRLGFGQEPMPPHNLTYTFIGTGLLWVGWFGFNAGSALAADARAVSAFVGTHLAAAAGVIGWSLMEWLVVKRPSILGACSGAVAGLVCITPASGFVTPIHGMILGLAAGVVCFLACTKLKNAFGYDDSLDAFGVHGVGGTLGALLTGVFATPAVTGDRGTGSLMTGNVTQFINQGIGVLAAVGIAVVGSVILLKLIDVTIGLRVTQDDEIRGLDLSQHGEEGYIYLTHP